jgi:ribosomal protein L7/L12
MIEFLKRVVLSNASREIREDALERLLTEVKGARKVGTHEVSVSCFNEIIASLQAKKKIHAIKAFREETKEGLLESKNAVEAFMAERGYR